MLTIFEHFFEKRGIVTFDLKNKEENFKRGFGIATCIVMAGISAG